MNGGDFPPDMVSVVLLNNFEIKMFITVKYWCNVEYWPRLNIEPGAYFNLEKWDQKSNSYPGSSSTALIFFEPIMTFTRWKMSLLEINFIYRQSFELCLITGTCCTRFKFREFVTRMVLGIFEALDITISLNEIFNSKKFTGRDCS